LMRCNLFRGEAGYQWVICFLLTLIVNSVNLFHK